MKLGVSIFPTDYSVSPTDLAVAAEERGFDSLWFPEHSHIPVSRLTPWPGGGDLPQQYYDCMDPFVALAAAAAVTKTIKLGTGICLVIQRDPIQTAKEVATLDKISGGRVQFGVGGGWNLDEISNHGTEFKTRFRLMGERIAAMKEIWTQEQAEYHGEFVDFDPIFAAPKPVQKPYPPIIVGGGFPHSAKRVIEYGDGWEREDLDVWGRFAYDVVRRKADERDAWLEDALRRPRLTKPARLILSGGAGSGKSTTVRAIVRMQRERKVAREGGAGQVRNCKLKQKRVQAACVLSAPTGTASFQMKYGATDGAPCVVRACRVLWPAAEGWRRLPASSGAPRERRPGDLRRVQHAREGLHWQDLVSC